MARSQYVHSGRVLARMQTRSPAARPRSMRPRPISATMSPTSAYVTSCQAPSCLKRTATAPAWTSAARAARSAIVLEPVDGTSVAAVLPSISPSSCEEADSRLPRGAGGDARRVSGGGGLRLGREALGLQVGQEQRLVDPALEDRHPELHALLDDLAAVETGLASELSGRQVDCHVAGILRWVACTPLIADATDTLNEIGGCGPTNRPRRRSATRICVNSHA